MTRALIILACTIDHNSDTAEVLQAADIDRRRWIIATVLHPDTGNVVEELAQTVWLLQLDLFLRHDADRR